jgi:hypothetical protein
MFPLAGLSSRCEYFISVYPPPPPSSASCPCCVYTSSSTRSLYPRRNLTLVVVPVTETRESVVRGCLVWGLPVAVGA